MSSGILLGLSSSTVAQDNPVTLKTGALEACKVMISEILVPIIEESVAPYGQELREAVISISFESFNDLSGGLGIYFEWERVEVELRPHPTWGISLFLPSHCYADTDTRKITKVGFFRGNDFESFDPDAIGRVFDDRAAELIASDQGTSF